MGGTYDLDLNWKQPHAAHSEGRATDLKTNGLDPRWLKIIKRHWETVTIGIVGDETRTSKPHFHLMFGDMAQ